MMPIVSRNTMESREESGAVLVLVALAMVALIGFVALAVDLGYQYVVKNELQNAADAGALAGASVLFNPNATPPDAPQDQDAIATAKNTAVLNKSGGIAIPTPNVEVGHYTFASSPGTPGTFTPNDASSQSSNWQTRSLSDLNADISFINAVRVTASRSVPAFFSSIWGDASFGVSAQAIAYIGFSGPIPPCMFDQPISVCQSAITNGSGEYTCTFGQMLSDSEQTARWTDFEQGASCSGLTANANCINALITGKDVAKSCKQATQCPGTGNPNPLVMGQDLGITNGTQGNDVSALYDAWQSYEQGKTCADGTKCSSLGSPCSDGSTCSNSPRPWPLTLPVTDCSKPNCSPLLGAVVVNVIWVIDKNSDLYKGMEPTPTRPVEMADPNGNLWKCTYADCGTAESPGQCCWDGTGAPSGYDSFTKHFKMMHPPGSSTPAPAQQKTIYFVPSCKMQEPVGGTGGQNFGVLAKYPVLVQ